jgi:hypothetical protein
MNGAMFTTGRLEEGSMTWYAKVVQLPEGMSIDSRGVEWPSQVAIGQSLLIIQLYKSTWLYGRAVTIGDGNRALYTLKTKEMG